MSYEELLERIEAYCSGQLPPEEARYLEAALERDPLLAMTAGLHRLEAIRHRLPAETITRLPTPPAGLRFPRLWLFSLLAGAVVVGSSAKKHNHRQRDESARPGGSQE